MNSYSHLLSPGRIGTMELRNRILMAPMGEELAELDGTSGPAQISYLEARARGGAALVTLGSVAVAWPSGTANKRQNGLNLPEFEPGIRALADAAHRHGAKLALQVSHMGKVARNDIIDGRPMWVPSKPSASGFDSLLMMMTADEMQKSTEEMMGPNAKASFHEMTHADILTLIGWFADAVENARDWGVDGIELHAGHGYILDEFLSGASNRRNDEYGGDIRGRARLLLEVIAAIRERVGDDYPLWARINALEYFTQGANTFDDALELAPLLEAAGLDAIHVSAYADSNIAIGFTESHTAHEPGKLVDFARQIKAVVGIPIIAVGRIEPAVGDALMSEGAVDFIAMGRKLLADPELPNKLAAETALDSASDVRPCMYHYRCIGNIFTREGVRCASNPFVGRESEMRMDAAVVSKRIAIIGGGPAGMETARISALRGHRVTLIEAHEYLGGRLAFAAATYAPNADMLAWLTRQITQLDIDVRLSTVASAALIESLSPDVVIDATGGIWRKPNIGGAQLDHVRDLASLRGWTIDGEPLTSEVSANIVIIGGGRAGCGFAHLARTQGHRVTVMEESQVFAPQFGMPGRWRHVHELLESGVALKRGARATEITPTSVRYSDAEGDHEAPANVVITVPTVEANPGIAAAFDTRNQTTALPFELHRVGDCTGPRFLEGSLLDATQLAIIL